MIPDAAGRGNKPLRSTESTHGRRPWISLSEATRCRCPRSGTTDLVFYGRIRTPWEMQVPLHFAVILAKVPLHFAAILAKVPLHFAEIGINELDYECCMRYLVFER